MNPRKKNGFSLVPLRFLGWWRSPPRPGTKRPKGRRPSGSSAVAQKRNPQPGRRRKREGNEIKCETWNRVGRVFFRNEGQNTIAPAYSVATTPQRFRSSTLLVLSKVFVDFGSNWSPFRLIYPEFCYKAVDPFDRVVLFY